MEALGTVILERHYKKYFIIIIIILELQNWNGSLRIIKPNPYQGILGDQTANIYVNYWAVQQFIVYSFNKLKIFQNSFEKEIIES